MKILPDENLDQGFSEFLPNHDALHIVDFGWQGMKNGKPLALLEEGGFQALITADKNMAHQQAIQNRPFTLIVLDIHPNILMNQAACLGRVEETLADFQPGTVKTIEGPHPKRDRGRA